MDSQWLFYKDMLSSSTFAMITLLKKNLTLCYSSNRGSSIYIPFLPRKWSAWKHIPYIGTPLVQSVRLDSQPPFESELMTNNSLIFLCLSGCLEHRLCQKKKIFHEKKKVLLISGQIQMKSYDPFQVEI